MLWVCCVRGAPGNSFIRQLFIEFLQNGQHCARAENEATTNIKSLLRVSVVDERLVMGQPSFQGASNAGTRGILRDESCDSWLSPEETGFNSLPAATQRVHFAISL